MQTERYVLLRLILVIVTCLVVSPVVADVEFPSPPAAAEVCAFLADCGDAAYAVVQAWQGLQLRYDVETRSLEGRWLIRVDTAVRGRAALAACSTITLRRKPSQRLHSLEVVVVGPDGEKRWRQKDLDWNETTERDGEVVVLDGTLATAFVPGVQVGDRVRVQLEYRVRGWQGLPPIELGDPTAPCLNSACEMHLSPADEVIWTALGPQPDPGLLLYEAQPDEGRHVWRLPRAMEATATCDGQHSHVRLVPHLAAIGADVPRSMVFGRTWEDVGEAYLMDIDPLFAGDAEMAAVANSLTAGTTDIVDRIDRIYTWVQQRCHYLGLFSGTDAFTPKSARSVYELGSGDCKGLASLLIAMLRHAGVPAYPVLVLTGDAGPFAPDVPNILQFNHFIVWADDGDGGLLLDGTVDHCPAGLLPQIDARFPVLLLRPGAVALIDVPASCHPPGVVDRTLVGRLEADGTLSYDITCTLTGTAALLWRNRLAGEDAATVSDLVQPLLGTTAFATQQKPPVVAGLDAWRAPLVVSSVANSRAPLPHTADGIFAPRRILGGSLPEPPDAPCGTSRPWVARPVRRVAWRIELPTDYALAAPESLTLITPWLAWNADFRQEGRVLLVTKEIVTYAAELSTAQVDSLAQQLRRIDQAEAGYCVIQRP